MIPVRAEGLPRTATRTFDELPTGHPLRDEFCPACDEPLSEQPVALIYIGPGSDPEDQAKARAGRWHTGAAVAVHAACAGTTEETKP